jgi:alpha-L-fucosidase
MESAKGEKGGVPPRIFPETDEERARRRAWWERDRFGMFIHFGLYSVGARHEWTQSREGLEADEYRERYFRRFNPDLLDAREWARAARAAGMRYAVLTAKHHEGFCLWDTATSDFKSTNTPFGRDIVREFLDVFRAEGLRVGLYFSLIDWHHPDYRMDETHPLMRKNAKIEDRAALAARLDEGRDMARYRDYMFAQARELLTGYGPLDIVWFDYTPAGKSWRDWNAVEFIRMVRSLQPRALVDSRLDLMDSDDGWDFVTPEQIRTPDWPTVRGRRVPWETCQTFSGAWGYSRDEATWKSVPQLVEMLSETVSHGGNLILNVGPTARGEFDGRAAERLQGLAAWMRRHSRSIYGCTVAPEGLKVPNGTALTWNPETKRLYVHLYDYPCGFLPLDFFDRVAWAQFLHDGSELILRPPQTFHRQSGDIRPVGGLNLPVTRPDVAVPVVEIELKDFPWK